MTFIHTFMICSKIYSLCYLSYWCASCYRRLKGDKRTSHTSSLGEAFVNHIFVSNLILKDMSGSKKDNISDSENLKLAHVFRYAPHLHFNDIIIYNTHRNCNLRRMINRLSLQWMPSNFKTKPCARQVMRRSQREGSILSRLLLVFFPFSSQIGYITIAFLFLWVCHVCFSWSAFFRLFKCALQQIIVLVMWDL